MSQEYHEVSQYLMLDSWWDTVKKTHFYTKLRVKWVYIYPSFYSLSPHPRSLVYFTSFLPYHLPGAFLSTTSPWTPNMKQHSTDGCGPRDGAAGDTVRATLERETRFRDDRNMITATQRRARREYDGRATVLRVTRCG